MVDGLNDGGFRARPAAAWELVGDRRSRNAERVDGRNKNGSRHRDVALRRLANLAVVAAEGWGDGSGRGEAVAEVCGVTVNVVSFEQFGTVRQVVREASRDGEGE